MSKPAQRPLELAAAVTTELLLLTLSGAAGLTVVFVLMVVGVLPDMEKAAWSGVAAGPILIGTAGLAYLGLERLLATADEPPRPLRDRERAGVGISLALALGGVIIAILGSMILGIVQQQLFATEVEEQRAILELVARRDPFELWLLGVSAVILAPIAEELLFRHMFFRRLLHRVGPNVAWVLPALAFALVHWNPVGLVIYVWLGSVFAMAYWLSGRLWVAMLVHSGHNAFALSMLLWAPEALP